MLGRLLCYFGFHKFTDRNYYGQGISFNTCVRFGCMANKVTDEWTSW